MNDELKKYYEYLKKNGGDVPPTYDQFAEALSDEGNAKKYYDYVRKNKFDAPDNYEVFSSTLGIGGAVKKKDQTEVTPPVSGSLDGNSELPAENIKGVGQIQTGKEAKVVGVKKTGVVKAEDSGIDNKAYAEAMGFDQPQDIEIDAPGFGESDNAPVLNKLDEEIVNKKQPITQVGDVFMKEDEQRLNAELNAKAKQLEQYIQGLKTTNGQQGPAAQFTLEQENKLQQIRDQQESIVNSAKFREQTERDQSVDMDAVNQAAERVRQFDIDGFNEKIMKAEAGLSDPKNKTAADEFNALVSDPGYKGYFDDIKILQEAQPKWMLFYDRSGINYDGKSFKPVAWTREEYDKALQDFLDNDMKFRKDPTNNNRPTESDEFSGKTVEELSDDQRRALLAQFNKKYIPAEGIQKYLNDQGQSFDIGKGSQVVNSVIGGGTGVFSSMLDGLDPSKLGDVDVLNNLWLQASNSDVTKLEFDRNLKYYKESILGNMEETQWGMGYKTDQYKPLPGITPVGQWVDKRNVGGPKTYNIYTEDQIKKWMDQMPSYEAIAGGAKSPFAYKNGSLGEAADKVREFQKYVKTNPVYEDSFLLNKLGQGVGSTGAFVLSALVTRGAGMSSTLGAVVTGGFSVAGEEYRAAIEGGATSDEAKLAYWGGFGLGASEAVTIERWLKRISTTKGLEKIGEASFFQGIEEGGQEIFQSVGSDVLAKLLYDEARKIGDTAWEDGSVGFATGFLMTSIGSAMKRNDLTPADKELLDKAVAQLDQNLEDRKEPEVKKEPVSPSPIKPEPDEKAEETSETEVLETEETVSAENAQTEKEVKYAEKENTTRKLVEYNGKNYVVTLENGVTTDIKEEGGFKADLTELTAKEISKKAMEETVTEENSENDEELPAIQLKNNTGLIQAAADDLESLRGVIDNDTWFKLRQKITAVDGVMSYAISKNEPLDDKVFEELGKAHTEILNLKEQYEQNNETEDAYEGEIGTTESVITEGESIISEAESLSEDEDEGATIEKVDQHIRKIDAKIKKLSEEFDTTEIEHEMPNVVVGQRAKKEVKQFQIEISKKLGWEIPKDRKGKPDYAYDNIAPAGGDVHFRLDIPNSGGLQAYVSVKYDPNYSRETGYYNYKFQEFFYRIENPNAKGQDQYVGSNQWEKKLMDSDEFADLIEKEAAKYINKNKAKEDIEKIVKETGAPEGKVIIGRPGATAKPLKKGPDDIIINGKIYTAGVSPETKGLDVINTVWDEDINALEKEVEGVIQRARERGEEDAIDFYIEKTTQGKSKPIYAVRFLGKKADPDAKPEIKKDTGLVDGINNLKSNPSALQLFKSAMDRGLISEHFYNDIGLELAELKKDKKGKVEAADVAEIIMRYHDKGNPGKKDDTLAAEIQAAINKEYEETEEETKPDEVTPSVKRPKLKNKIKKIEDEELKGLWDELRDSMGDLNTGFNPTQLSIAGKIVAKYTELGILKFADIVAQAYEEFGENAIKIFDGLKQAYNAHAATATDEVFDKMSTSKEVRDFDFNSLFEEEDTDATDAKRTFIDGFKHQVLKEGKKFNIVSLRALAKESGLDEIKDTEIQEYVELGMVEMARQITSQKKLSDEEKVQHLEILYRIMPTISMRSSERISKQQYSTPIPIAFIASAYVGDKGTGLEPSAGNGMLTIASAEENWVVNDLDEVRASNLEEQGFKKVTNQDALEPFTGKYDRVAMNPPFGGSPTIVVDGYKISGLDEQMVVNALQSLKPNGKAAIIIGGHNSYDEKGRLKAELTFFNYLYNHYNVSDVINIDGQLYQKQGTTFPIRLILINGVKAEPKGAAPLINSANNEVVSTFEDLFSRVNEIKKDESLLQSDLDADNQSGNPIYDQNTESTQDEGTTTGQTGGKDNRTGKTGTGGKGKTGQNDNGQTGSELDGEQEPGRDGKGDNADGSVSNLGTDISGQEDGIGDNDTGGSGTDLSGDVTESIPRKFDSGDLKLEKVPYIPQSGNPFNVGSVVPTQMAAETEKTLSKISKENGGIDRYVRNKLGYKNNEELYAAFSAEQIDGIAIAVTQIENGMGAIIGDMTGVGKGRIAAGIIRYAVRQGLKPVFLTEGAHLFSDMYRDLVAIGSGDLAPFIINDKSSKSNPDITDEDGKVIYKSLPREKKLTSYLNGEIPENFSMVMATYSQFSSVKSVNKRGFLSQFAQGNILILDESHNVSGDSNSGEYFMDVLQQSKGVTFLSATFAKRPDNMPIYALKTAMQDANMTTEELISAVQRGGVALQEILSALLVESGQMIRRERQFDAEQSQYDVLDDMKDYHRNIADKITDAIRDVIQFQKKYIKPIIEGMDDEASADGERVGTRSGTDVVGVANTPFASKVFNVVDQMLFAIKAEQTADMVIEELKAGRKPVIKFKSTMESFLKAEGYQVGDVLEKADFTLTLMRALDGTFRYTKKTAGGDSIHETLSISDLSKAGRDAYEDIYKKIKEASTGISVSPIDTMIARIKAAGYSVAEITGRELMLEMQPDGSAIVVRRKEKDKKKIARDYNAGDLDVLMFNASGATGISLHASKSFKDQRQRVMFSAQLQLDINKEIQARGRIDRTGQVLRGLYRYIVSAIPAESRLLMMFQKKVKSLDANTTSSQKSKQTEMEMEDFLNKYGDQVVLDYLIDNPDINEALTDPYDLAEQSEEALSNMVADEGTALRISGYVAILPTADQEKFYTEISERYAKHIEYLESNNENDLEIKIMPLNAKTIASKVAVVGKRTGSAFGADSILETVEVDILKKPMKIDEINKLAEKNLEGETPNALKTRLTEELDEAYEERLVQEDIKIRNEYAEKIAAVPERVQKEITGEKIEENQRAEREAQMVSDLENARGLRLGRMRDKERVKYENVSNILNYVGIGRVYKIPMGSREETSVNFSNGILVDINFGKAKYKFNPGNITLRFAVSDGRRIVQTPLSQQKFLNSIIATTQLKANTLNGAVENWDTTISTKPRGIRYIITGNLLQAVGTAEGMLVSYSTQDGELKKGLLLPEYFKPQGSKVRVPINQAGGYIRTMIAPITTSDMDVKITREQGGYTIEVPLTTKAGGKYFLDPDVRALVVGEDFRQAGTKMMGRVSESNLDKLLNILTNKHSSTVEIDGAEFEKSTKQNPDDGDISTPINMSRAKRTKIGKTVGYAFTQMKNAFPNVDIEHLEAEAFEEALKAAQNAKRFSDDFGTYGFFDPVTGRVVLNVDYLSPETTLEEFSHLWLYLLEHVNNAVYIKGESMAMKHPMFEQIKNDPAYEAISNNDREIANEVMAKMIRDEAILNLSEKTWAQNFKNWLKEFWAGVKNILRKIGFNPDQLNINTLSLSQLTKGAAKELTRGVPITYMTSEQLAALSDTDSGVFVEPKLNSQLIKPTPDGPMFTKMREMMRRNLLLSRGAGKDLQDLFQRKGFELNTRRHEIGLLMKDFRRDMKTYADGLGLTGEAKNEQITRVLNNVDAHLHGDAQLVQIPKQLHEVVGKIREKIDAFTREILKARIALDEDIIYGINEYLELYLQQNFNMINFYEKKINEIGKELQGELDAISKMDEDQLSDQQEIIWGQMAEIRPEFKKRMLADLQAAVRKQELKNDRSIAPQLKNLLKKYEALYNAAGFEKPDQKPRVPATREELDLNKQIRNARVELGKLSAADQTYSDEEIGLMLQLISVQEALEAMEGTQPRSLAQKRLDVQKLARTLNKMNSSLENARKMDLAVEGVEFSQNDDKTFDLSFIHVNGTKTDFWKIPLKDIETLFGGPISKKILMEEEGYHELSSPEILTNNDLYARMISNMGKYITRSYQLHDNPDFAKNWRTILGPEIYNEAAAFLKQQMSDSNIHRVKALVNKDGSVTVSFKNKYNIETEEITVRDLSRLAVKNDGVLTDKDVELLKKRLETDGGRVEMALSRPTAKQSFIKFKVPLEQLDGLMDSIVTKDGFKSIYHGLPVDGFDGGIFKKKQDIADPIRKLMGEYTDPYINATKTLLKMATGIENARLVQGLIDEGEGIYISNKQTKYHTVKLTKADLYSLGDRVVYVTQEVSDVLLSHKEKHVHGRFWNALVAMSGMTKAANTIYYPESQARNFFGAALNVIATGNFNFADMRYAISVGSQDMTVGQDVGTLMSTPLAVLRAISMKNFGYHGNGGKGKYDKEALRQAFLDASKYGVFNESLDANVIDDLNSLLSEGKMKEKYKNAVDAFAKPYQLSDNVFKIVQWKGEMATLKKAYPEKSNEAIMREAADIVRNTSPTYSMLPEALRKLSRFPLIATFVMFPAAMIKTRIEIMKQIGKEMRSGNPVLIGKAALRSAGLLGTISMGFILYSFFANRFGWDDDDNEAVNVLGPSYAENNLRLYISDDKKNPEFIDFTYLDPSALFYKPIIAFNRSDGGFLVKTKDAINEFSTPYVATDIFVEQLFEALTNANEIGIPIYKKTDPLGLQIFKASRHAMQPMIPKFIESANRLYMAGMEEDNTWLSKHVLGINYSKNYELDNELANLMLGAKARGVDELKAGRNKMANTLEKIQEPAMSFKKDEMSLEEANKRSQKYFDEMVLYVEALEQLGFGKDELYGKFAWNKKKQYKSSGGLLDDAGVPRYLIDQIEKREFLGIDETKEHNFKGY